MVSTPAPADLPPPDPASRVEAPTPTATPGRLARLRARVESAKVKGREVEDQLEAARPRHPTLDVAFATIERDASTAGSVLAAAVAFRLFLFVVPYVFVFVYGFGLAASATDTNPQQVAEDAGIAGLLASTINTAAAESLVTRIAVFIAASIALVSTARSFLKVLAAVHALAWQLPPKRTRRLTRAAFLFIAIVTGCLAVIQLVAWLRDESYIAGVTASLLFIVVPTVLWLVLSMRFFVHAPTAGRRDLLPGAVLVGVGLQILHLVTVYWIARVLAAKSEMYGAIGAALAILFWAYLVGRLFAASALLNAAAWNRRHSLRAPLPALLPLPLPRPLAPPRPVAATDLPESGRNGSASRPVASVSNR